MPGVRLGVEERQAIEVGLARGEPCVTLARRLGRPTSTVAREVRRNGGRERYRAIAAQRACAGALGERGGGRGALARGLLGRGEREPGRGDARAGGGGAGTAPCGGGAASAGTAQPRHPPASPLRPGRRAERGPEALTETDSFTGSVLPVRDASAAELGPVRSRPACWRSAVGGGPARPEPARGRRPTHGIAAL